MEVKRDDRLQTVTDGKCSWSLLKLKHFFVPGSCFAKKSRFKRTSRTAERQRLATSLMISKKKD